MPWLGRKGEFPLPRERYQVRTMMQIRDNPHRALKAGYVNKGRGCTTRRKAYDLRRKMKARIEKEIDEKARELQTLDKELAERERIRDLASKAPSVKEMRGAVAQLFKQHKLDPIEELIKLVQRRGKGALSSKEKATILKELAQYQAPKPKAIDVQADIDQNVTVSLADFRSVTKAQMKVVNPEPAATDEDYDEFEVREG